jgi:hypothetical protein
MRRITATLLVTALAACGGARLSHTVDEDKLRDMSRQGQIWVHDAENEMVVALDRLDEAKDELSAVKRRIREAEEAVERSESGKSRQAVQVAEGWLVALEGLENWAKALVKLQRLGLVVARASVELAKAQVIQREDLLGGKDFNVGDYQAQYNRLKGMYDKRHRFVDALRRKARKKEERWWTLRRRFTAQTGDHDSGLWID